MQPTRCTFIGTVGASITAGIAGCSSGDSSETTDEQSPETTDQSETTTSPEATETVGCKSVPDR